MAATPVHDPHTSTMEVSMIRPVTAGLDGSPESLAAAEWAAREAEDRGLPLRLVQAWIWRQQDVPVAEDLDTQKRWALSVLEEAKDLVCDRHPGLAVSTELICDTAPAVLLAEAEAAEMLVLGSSGHGAVAGFLLGSVGQQVLARAQRPVILVRAGHRPANEGGGAAEHDSGNVVVGLQEPAEIPAPLLEFAFNAAAVRGSALHAVHAPDLPPLYGYGPAVGRLAGQEGGITRQAERALTDALRPWRERYPKVPVTHAVELAHASSVVLSAAPQAGLVVVGRKMHRRALGMRIGPVAHAVLHHATAPVAVVPHD
ncbi:universal stress protein [Streptomyces aurantiacus]|uniref:Putative Universal stress protein n=1 Tax=Streptomyces aurantiacus JA 4570 TaxID=1286094 RepID=S3ZUK0_9ACTN|nr:universal stress protein [Streptomyces aurantiacus]EPH46469.1 putative Universal stress protein [Streptomyces aurantiacus JA 4570]